MRKGLVSLILVILLILIVNVVASPNNRKKWWEKCVIVGDGFRIEFFRDEIDALKKDYHLEALHSTVQAWMEYSEWAKYPEAWNNVRDLIQAAHLRGLPVGVVTGYHPTDVVNAPYNSPKGFLYYYRMFVRPKWRWPDGREAEDPYSVGLSRSFSGALVARIEGEGFMGVMQPQNPYWLDFLASWAAKAVEEGADAVFFDSPDTIFVFCWGGGWGCTDTWEGQGLAKYLGTKLGWSEDKVENFCLKDYLDRKYKVRKITGNYIYLRDKFRVSWPIEAVEFSDRKAVLKDPVFKEALIYWYRSALNFVKELSQRVKEYAKSRGKEVLVASNEYMAWIPHITLTPYMDVVSVETNQFKPPPYQTNAVVSKIAQASANYSKPVWISEWVLYFSNPYNPYPPPRDVSNLIKLKIAEAYSTGAIMLVPLGTGYSGEGWPPRRLVLGSERWRREVATYYKFIAEHRDLFVNTTGDAKIALLVSLPTAIWGYIPALGLYESEKYRNEVYGWARALDALHLDYDVLLLGMEGILATNAVELMDKYALIIAPGATHISDHDLEALKKYLANGGKLIVTRDFAKYDEMNNPRDEAKVEEFLKSNNVIVTESRLGISLYRALSKGNFNSQIIRCINETIVKALPSPPLWSDAPWTVAIRVRKKYNDTTILHLINYDYRYHRDGDWVVEVDRVQVKLKLEKDYEALKVELLSPDFEGVQALNYSICEDRTLELTIPKLKLWSIVIVKPEIARAVHVKPEEKYLSTNIVNFTAWVEGQPTSVTLVINGTKRIMTYNETLGAYVLTLNLCDGTYLWFIEVRSRFGLNSSFEKVLIVDTTAPKIHISPSNLNGSILREPVIMKIKVEEPNLRKVKVSLDNKLLSAEESSSLILNPLEFNEGRHTILVEAIDLAGNIAMSTLTVTIDTTPPIIKITEPPQGIILTGNSLTIRWRIHDNITGVEKVLLMLDNTVVTDVTGLQSYYLKNLPPGKHVIELVAIDRAGNEGKATVTIEIRTQESTTLTVAGIAVIVVLAAVIMLLKGRTKKESS